MKRKFDQIFAAELAFRVRISCVAALIVLPSLAVANGIDFFVELFGTGNTNWRTFGLGTAMLIYGGCFVWPWRLAGVDAGREKNLWSFVAVCIVLFSGLLWFPLNQVLTS